MSSSAKCSHGGFCAAECVSEAQAPARHYRRVAHRVRHRLGQKRPFSIGTDDYHHPGVVFRL